MPPDFSFDAKQSKIEHLKIAPNKTLSLMSANCPKAGVYERLKIAPLKTLLPFAKPPLEKKRESLIPAGI